MKEKISILVIKVFTIGCSENIYSSLGPWHFHVGWLLPLLQCVVHSSSTYHIITYNQFLLKSSFNFTISFFFPKQAKLLKIFPSKYWAIMLACIIASMQSAVIGLCLNRQKAAWSLGWNLQLLTIVYSVSFLA